MPRLVPILILPVFELFPILKFILCDPRKHDPILYRYPQVKILDDEEGYVTDEKIEKLIKLNKRDNI